MSADTSPVLRNYTLRLLSAHEADNAMSTLRFEIQRDGEQEWAAHTSDIHSSPFLDFLFDAFRCQLAYLRMNATERGIRLVRVRGLARVRSADFRLTGLDVGFAIETPDAPSADDLVYLAERCLACPVSRNLPHVAGKRTVVTAGMRPSLPS